ncbi:ral guanine nucleotide dissociation stimulator-like isoform X4 [Diceros bicornis minor]|uniref:ral guanine nucleotide dissociation stimulator-like isoform X4 n=1 Tax=Diceros bicornis minor TaxID=77932 RepID=UPI0026ECBEC6|nr:ral guanine nucleotide dissociation stimulator-like isoform X4 [Diceros bicornis minor]
MDAEPFQKVVPSQCLGSTWGKRNKPGSEHLAHTVQANIDHFRRVANLVITTCLGVPSMMAQDRECEILKNFSSPRTVISSLQKTSICHLKNTWRKFPGGALHVCPPEGNPQRVQEKQQQQQVSVPVEEGLCPPSRRPQIKRGGPFLLVPQCLNPPVEVTRRGAWKSWCRMDLLW